MGAAEAREQTHLAGEKVSACNRQMQELMEAMDRIRASSDEIGKIIKKDIAETAHISFLMAGIYIQVLSGHLA